MLLAAAIATLGCWRRLGQSFRWIALAVLHATWLVLALSALEGAPEPATARAQVAMLTFTTLAAGVYAWLGGRLAAAVSVAWRAPYFAVLLVAVVMLPYYRGARGQLRDDAIIELNAKDAAALCDFACGASGCAPAGCQDEQWRLIAIGKDKVVLASVRDSKVYVTPVSAVQTFRITRRATP